MTVRRRHPPRVHAKSSTAVFEPWTGKGRRLGAARTHLSAEDLVRLRSYGERRVPFTQIAALLGGKAYAVIIAALEEMGLAEPLPAPAAKERPRPVSPSALPAKGSMAF